MDMLPRLRQRPGPGIGEALPATILRPTTTNSTSSGSVARNEPDIASPRSTV